MKAKISERTGADWSAQERADAKVEARAFVLNTRVKQSDPEVAPMLSSLFDDKLAFLEEDQGIPSLNANEITAGLKSAFKSLQSNQDFEGADKQRVNALVDELALFLREKNQLIQRKALRS